MSGFRKITRGMLHDETKIYEVLREYHIFDFVNLLFFCSYLRSLAYRKYIQFVYGQIGKRIPLPVRGYHATCTKFKQKIMKIQSNNISMSSKRYTHNKYGMLDDHIENKSTALDIGRLFKIKMKRYS